MKKTDFLNYVSHLLETKDSAYYENNDKYFYFYHKNLTFNIKSNPDAAFLVIEEGKGSSAISETISLTSEETIGLLEKLLPLIPTNHDDYQQQKEAFGVDKFNSYIALFDEFLRNYNPKKEIEQFCEKDNLENYVLHFPLDGINHICRIGRLGGYNYKHEYLLTSVVKVPFFILLSNQPKSPCIPYDLIIPSWKIKQYPILENFIEPKIFGTDFKDTFQSMVNQFSQGKELYKDVLEYTMPEKHIKTKNPKI